MTSGYASAGRMDVLLLGPLEVRDGDRVIDLGGPKPRALLAVLALQRNRVVSTDSLTDALWGEAPPSDPQNLVQGYVSALRKRLGRDRIITRPSGYELRVADGEVDLDRFERLVRDASAARTRGDLRRARSLLAAALELWRGELLQEARYEPWVETEAVRLDEERQGALRERLEIDLDIGRGDETVPELEALVARDPLDERSWVLLVRALLETGRRSDAAVAFRRAVDVLTSELGVEPGPELRRLAARVAVEEAEAVGVPAGDAPWPAPRHNLPAIPTSFVARERDLARVRRLLDERRPVTLVGIGGVGKTRLAVEIAGASLRDFPGGTWLVDLSPLSDGRAIPLAVAEVLGVATHGATSVEDVLMSSLAERQTLLVIDNCEHLLEPAARFVQLLVERAPGAHLLATSRQPLGVVGEVAWPVQPLELPDETADVRLATVVERPAARLFLDRAAAVVPDFSPSDVEAPVLARICRRLDGIPLAIELAAARVAILSLAEIDDRLSDRFRLLATDSPVQPERHRTLRATIDWSFELLSPDEQRFLARLAVFAGGFDLGAAGAVWGAGDAGPDTSLDLLSALVRRSLVVREAGEAGSRYRLLDSIREYAAERLAEDPVEERDAQERHARYYLAIAEKAERAVKGPDQARWLAILRLEDDNVQAAFRHLGTTPDCEEVVIRLAAAGWWIWEHRGIPQRGFERLLTLIERTPRLAPELLAPVLYGAGSLAQTIGENGRALELGRRALATFRSIGDEQGAARALQLLGRVATNRGDFRRAEVLLGCAIAAQRRGSETWQLALALHHLGLLNRLRGRYDEARANHEESLALFTRLGDGIRTGYAQLMLGTLAMYEGDYDDAIARSRLALPAFEDVRHRYGVCHVKSVLADAARLAGELDRAQPIYEACLTEFGELGDRNCQGSVLASLALLARDRGQRASAARLLGESLALRRQMRDLAGIAEVLDIAASIAAGAGQTADGVELTGAAARIRADTGSVPPGWQRRAVERLLADARRTMGRAAFEQARERGFGLELGAAIAAAELELARHAEVPAGRSD
jgi:predicted ATPase